MGAEETPGATDAHDCARGELLLRHVRDDDMDAAIEAGLMRYIPCLACDPELAAQLIESQQRLVKAWAARDRYRARNERLARRVAERDAKRAALQAEKKTSLAPSVAAILARAKAKAAERRPR